MVTDIVIQVDLQDFRDASNARLDSVHRGRYFKEGPR